MIADGMRGAGLSRDAAKDHTTVRERPQTGRWPGIVIPSISKASRVIQDGGGWHGDLRTPFPAIAAGVLLLLIGTPGALGRGSQVGRDDPWNPEHIDHLPPEVRNAVAHMCGDSARAAHYFATYLDNSRIIRLHFEHLQCGEAGRFCKAESCLRQEYFSRGGQYRLLKSYYGRNDD